MNVPGDVPMILIPRVARAAYERPSQRSRLSRSASATTGAASSVSLLAPDRDREAERVSEARTWGGGSPRLGLTHNNLGQKMPPS